MLKLGMKRPSGKRDVLYILYCQFPFLRALGNIEKKGRCVEDA